MLWQIVGMTATRNEHCTHKSNLWKYLSTLINLDFSTNRCIGYTTKITVRCMSKTFIYLQSHFCLWGQSESEHRCIDRESTCMFTISFVPFKSKTSLPVNLSLRHYADTSRCTRCIRREILSLLRHGLKWDECEK